MNRPSRKEQIKINIEEGQLLRQHRKSKGGGGVPTSVLRTSRQVDKCFDESIKFIKRNKGSVQRIGGKQIVRYL